MMTTQTRTGLRPQIAAIVALLGSALLSGCIDFRADRQQRDRFVATMQAEQLPGQPTGVMLGKADGQGLVLIHGTPGSWDSWIALLEGSDLPERWRIIAMDRPGWGDDGAAPLAPRLADQARAVEAAVRLLGDRPVVLVGHSLGAPVVIAVAERQLVDIDGVVLIGGSVDPGQERVAWYQLLARTPPLSWIVPRQLARADDEIEPLEAELRVLDQNWDRLTAPVIMLHGTEDRLVPVANVAYAVDKRLDLVQAMIIPDEGHFIPFTRFDLVVEALERLGVGQ
jgi:pimeloyl-ACP methyl ester carboxylesterase